ncbi:MAG: TraB/GumN family protein, partial [Flavobacteriales bacterium]|nr:TraB/GumN family protein [Flavobacteriales bacterium]
VHSRDARAFTYAHHVEALLPQVRTVAGELDPEEAAGGALSLMTAMMLPEGRRITDLYKRKKDRALVEAAMRERLGPMAGMFMRMKPFFVMAAMMENDLGSDRPVILDSHLLTRAQDGGNRVIGLETMAEQFAAINSASLKEQADMLLEHLRDDDRTATMGHMLDAYAAQDLAALERVAQSSGGLPDAMERALIGDRNRVMVHRMDSVLRADTTAIFLVGALHLPGHAGVVRLLRESGYHLEPVPMLPATERDEGPPPFGPPAHIDEGIRYVNDELGFAMDMYNVPEVSTDHEAVTVTSMAHGNATVVMREHAATSKGVDERLADLLAGAEGERVDVQGVEGRHLVFTEEGREMEFLFLLKDDHLWMVIAGDSDPARRAALLRSFRFTDRPE